MSNDAKDFVNWSRGTLQQVDEIRAAVIDVANSLANSYAYALPDTTLKGRDHAAARDRLFEALRKVKGGLQEARDVLETLMPDKPVAQ